MQKHDTTALSDKHREMLEVGSAIAPEIIGARGYRTVRRADVPVDFAGYQRRNGLVMPLYSPDGITTGYQLRPDRPRRDERGAHNRRRSSEDAWGRRRPQHPALDDRRREKGRRPRKPGALRHLPGWRLDVPPEGQRRDAAVL